VKGSQVGRVLGAAANAAKADAFAKQMRLIFDELAGLSASAAARELERRGYATARGGNWSARHVIRIRRRLEACRLWSASPSAKPLSRRSRGRFARLREL
jgi:Recombinase